MLTVAVVLRSGGEYRPEHVAALARDVAKHLALPHRFVALSDLETPGIERVKLRFGWADWWAKMELFEPNLAAGDILYLDLDTIVCGSLDDVASVGRLTLLSDFFHPALSASGLMFLPRVARQRVWQHWKSDPPRHILRCHAFDANGVRGDGKLIAEALPDAERFQNVVPGQVVSYKRDVGKGNAIPKGARVVCFHGQPRPWATPLWRPPS